MQPGELFAIDARIVQQDGPRAFFWLFGPPVYRNERIGNVAVVRISGPLEYHAEGWGDSYDDIIKRVGLAMAGDDVGLYYEQDNGWREDYEAAAHPGKPEYVVLRVDSPGGVVAGLHQAVAKLRRMSAESGIPLIAYVDEMAYSAAFAISCACARRVIPPSGFLGSVGVISTMVDQTARDRKEGYKFVVLTSGKRKADGHPHVPITDEMVAQERPRIAKLARFFYEDVREATGLPIATIQGFQAGRFLGADAKAAGLADDVMGWDDLLEVLLSDDAKQQMSGAAKALKSDDESGANASANITSENASAMNLGIEALIKRTEKAIAAEKDPKKLAKLAADLEAYERTKASVVTFEGKGDETQRKSGDDDDDDADDDDDSDDDDSDDESDEAAGDEDDEGESDSDEDADEADEEEDEEDEEEDDEEEDEEEEEEARVRGAALSSARSAFGAAKRSGKAPLIKSARAQLVAVKRLSASFESLSKKHHSLVTACRKATGKKSARAIAGALEGLKASASRTERVAKDLKREKAARRASRVDAMLKDARRDGRVTKAQVPGLRDKGLSDPKWLRGFLDTTPRMRTLGAGPLTGKAANGANDGDQRRTEALDAQKMTAEQRKAIETLAADSGKSFDEFLAETNKRSAMTADKANGVTR